MAGFKYVQNVALFIALAFFSCKKHNDPLPTGVHAKINSAKWMATSVRISHSIVPTAHGSIDFTTITATDTSRGDELGLSVGDLIKPGVYNLGSIAQIYYKHNGVPINFPSNSGVINVMSLSSINIQGTFKCANNFGNIITITDGTFNVPIP
jgi:hypothetical protein